VPSANIKSPARIAVAPATIRRDGTHSHTTVRGIAVQPRPVTTMVLSDRASAAFI
jgi:hypothetical protein